MDRRLFMSGWTLVLAGVVRPAAAATPKTVGLLWVSSAASQRHIGLVRDVLREKGFPEPDAVRLDATGLVDRYEALEDSARRVLQLKPDVILTYGSTGPAALKRLSASIPVVMLIGADPVKQGYAASFARPGGNMTGVCLVSTESGGKRLELLQRIRPALKRMAYLYSDQSQTEVNAMPVMSAMAKKLGFALDPVAIRLADDLEQAISNAARSGAEAFGMASSTMFVANARRIVEAIAVTRLPAVYPNAEFTDIGGVMSYGANMTGAFRLAGEYAARVLRGAHPRDMPIEQYNKFELVLNRRSAKAQGITIPESVLGLADRIIEA